jgi:calcineurin-like phosphoesterase family protein
MAEIFFASDTHLAHKNIVVFNREDGKKIRPYSSSEEHDEILIQNWNSVVKNHDTVYHLGDVMINKRGFENVHRLNGRKILIMGIHDIFGSKRYLEHFEDVRGYKVFENPTRNWICSHVPVHHESLGRWNANIHGHLHSNVIPDEPRYINVSMEQIGMTPISIEDVTKRLQENTEHYQATGRTINWSDRYV